MGRNVSNKYTYAHNADNVFFEKKCTGKNEKKNFNSTARYYSFILAQEKHTISERKNMITESLRPKATEAPAVNNLLATNAPSVDFILQKAFDADPELQHMYYHGHSWQDKSREDFRFCQRMWQTCLSENLPKACPQGFPANQ